MEPQEILDEARRLIHQHAHGDADSLFYANRFVFARLMLDERKTKTAIKKALFAAEPKCFRCGEALPEPVEIHLHRMDGIRGYSLENCVLMHPACHIAFHSENVRVAIAKRSGRPSNTPRVSKSDAPGAGFVAARNSFSKFYADQKFSYWWDISKPSHAKLSKYSTFRFVKADLREYASVSLEDIEPLLVESRLTTRNGGAWGIRVLKTHPDSLAFEPADRKGEWLFIPVQWKLLDKPAGGA